jgi:hypothetical protein
MRRSPVTSAVAGGSLGMEPLVSMLEGKPYSVLAFTVRGGRIVEIDILSDPERASQLDLTALEDD